MNARTKSILEAAVKEYIRTGAPATSKELAKRYDFGVKDATIRSELNMLTKEGFLTQLHTSGGRVPTDRGYQFFVAQTLDDVVDSRKILNNNRMTKLADNLQSGDLRQFIEGFSEETKLLGIGQHEDGVEFYKSGLESLYERLDSGTKKDFHSILHDFEMLDSRMKEIRTRIFNALSEGPQVFIGKKSPLTDSDQLSVITDCFDVGDHKVFIAIIGPKRMDYEKNLKLFKLLHEHTTE